MTSGSRSASSEHPTHRNPIHAGGLLCCRPTSSEVPWISLAFGSPDLRLLLTRAFAGVTDRVQPMTGACAFQQEAARRKGALAIDESPDQRRLAPYSH